MFLTRTVSTRASFYLLGSAVVVFFVIVFYAHQSLARFDKFNNADANAKAVCEVSGNC